MSGKDPRKPRRGTPIRVHRLGEEPGDDLSSSTSPEQRLAILAELSGRMWELTGRPLPAYERAMIPVRVIRRA